MCWVFVQKKKVTHTCTSRMAFHMVSREFRKKKSCWTLLDISFDNGCQIFLACVMCFTHLSRYNIENLSSFRENNKLL